MKDKRYKKLLDDGITPVHSSLIPNECRNDYVATIAAVISAQKQQLVPRFEEGLRLTPDSEYPWCCIFFNFEKQCYFPTSFKSRQAVKDDIREWATERYAVVPIQDLINPKNKSVEVDL